MPTKPTKAELDKMHELANSTLDPREVLESLLNDVPELKPLRDRLIADGLVQEVDSEGNLI